MKDRCITIVELVYMLMAKPEVSEAIIEEARAEFDNAVGNDEAMDAWTDKWRSKGVYWES